MWRLRRICLYLLFSTLIIRGFTQFKPADTASYKIITAGPEYKKPASYQKLWGRNWRIDWNTPVRVPYLWLNKVDGGLTPSRTNGGNETKGLRLQSPNGK